jgi:hypothetical protein
MRQGFVLSELTEKLNLSPDQQKTIGAIIADGRSQSKAAREDDTLSKDDKRQKMKDIMNSTRDQIRAALTPDQQKQFDAMHAHGEKPSGQAPDTSSAPPTPPPPSQ